MEEKKKTPQQRYAAKNIKQYKIDCMKTTESDLIEWLEKQPNRAGYIKRLIREDMARREKGEDKI